MIVPLISRPRGANECCAISSMLFGAIAVAINARSIGELRSTLASIVKAPAPSTKLPNSDES